MNTTVILVRHGQTEWNRIERFRGRYDVPLNETGLRQAEAVAQRIASTWKPVAIYASPLSRALQTAAAIASRSGLSVQPADGLIDIDYGMWQGKTNDEARQYWPDLLPAWFDHPETVTIPGGESLDGVRRRAMIALEEIVSQNRSETIVLVSHTVVNRLILLGVLGLGNDRFWHLRQEPCAINVIFAEGGDYILGAMNETGHLLE